MQVMRLLQHNNPPQHNYHNHKYRMLASIGKKKVVINKHNSTISIQISKFNKHLQYQLQQPYNTMQATHSFQHNNPPNTIIIITNIECLQILKSKK